MTSSTARHTLGPWKQSGMIVRQDCGDRLGPQIARVAGPEVAIVAECEANARLIAAAPELLAALEVARKWLVINDDRRSQSDIEVVEAALAAAKGGA